MNLSEKLKNLSEKINMSPLWQWPLIFFAPTIASNLDVLIDPESVYIKLLYGSLTMFLMIAGPALIQKIFRFESKVWEGKGMLRRDLDSGAKQCARIYLGRERPSFLLSPLSFLFMKWTFLVGEIDMTTGSISAYKVFVTNLVAEEKQCRAIGTNDQIKGDAATHVLTTKLNLREKIKNLKITEKEEMIAGTIKGLINSGLQIKEDVPL